MPFVVGVLAGLIVATVFEVVIIAIGVVRDRPWKRGD